MRFGVILLQADISGQDIRYYFARTILTVASLDYTEYGPNLVNKEFVVSAGKKSFN